ncbi:hypothetical protein M409DRAFT_69780 [Zasmidium cellare ATCC 36951]|uniref:Gfo/Idh/MocA-like oxidoreductase N-terminal domain-containing protein n=1 Tax=Zasmidium cellare ATCC 36951 TaxID=1080233 RepID=A0A6A6C306_ZASCE|nr:uncharacterized protein M409DRAFT_69780 [Zasmidium cellare ATCC 36951]KAF2161431.1 hypothetical protein M409DRAFT_69780 [Zasmidium cellare ATCC 36951]
MAVQQTYYVAVVGYGLSAKLFHIPFIRAHSRFKFEALVDRRATSPSSATTPELNGVNIFSSLSELLENGEFDVAVLCTPPWTHYELAVPLITSGKHVVLEKPATPTAEEAKELQRLAAKHQVRLAVYQNRRWDNDFLTVRELIKQGTLGAIVEFETHFDRFCPDVAPGSIAESKPGTGIVYDLGVHLIDQVYCLWGMPDRVTAFVDHLRDPRTQDMCTLLLHFSKRLVTIKATTHSAEQVQLRFWLRGDKGSFKKYHLDIQEPQLAEGKKPTDPEFGVEPEDRCGILTLIENGHLVATHVPNVPPQTYSAFYDQLAQALQGHDAPELPTMEQAMEVLRLVEMCLKSVEARRTMECR